jgi:hypothetical protein
MQEDKVRSIIEKIKRQHIAPEPKWRLNLKSYVFWVFSFLMVILGGLSFSLIIFNFLDFGPGVFHHFGFGKIIRTFVMTAPFLWIGLFFLALISGILIFRKTKRGYRYGVFFAGSLAVLAISILGVGMHLASVSEKLERGISRGFPGQRNLAFPIEGRWSNPEEKMLGGEVKKVVSEQIILLDFRGGTWEVYYSPQTEMRLRQDLAPGISIGVIGEKIGEKKFQAEFIHSLPPRGSGMPCRGACIKR